MMDTSVQQSLELKGQVRPYAISGVGEGVKKYPMSMLAPVEVESLDGKFKTTIEVRVIPNPLGDMKPVDWNDHKSNWPHLKDIDFPIFERQDVKILIGAADARLLASEVDIMHSEGDNAPVARKGVFGWTAIGRVHPRGAEEDQEPQASMIAMTQGRCYKQIESATEQFTKELEQDDPYYIQAHYSEMKQQAMDVELNDLVRKSIDMESLRTDEDMVPSREERRAVEQLRKATKLEDGRVEAPCLWKDGEPQLPNNYAYALTRLKNQEKSKIMKDPVALKMFQDLFHEMVDSGFLELVPLDELNKKEAYYIPLFPVWRDDSDTHAIRIVADCRAKFNNKCLNDGILKGPNFLNDLADVLLRFRHFPIALVADISKMFYRIGLLMRDRDYHRVLYRDSPNEEIRVYRYAVHCFGNAGSPAVALNAIRLMAATYADKYPRAAECILKSTLMDDNLDSFETPEEAMELAKQLKEMYSSLGMALRQFASNNLDVVASIPEVDRKKGFDLFSESEKDAFPTLKALGIVWRPDTDLFSFRGEVVTLEADTMRGILKSFTKIYDPLCFLLPSVIAARIIFQDCWKHSLGWDDPLPDEIKLKWHEWRDSLCHLGKVKVNRCLRSFPKKAVTKESLHVFCDASRKAYDAVAYLRVEYSDGTVSATLVMSRGRITPNKEITIPRLELNAAVIGAQLGYKIQKALNIQEQDVHLWSDSRNVICWLRTETKEHRLYVANRVQKIQDITNRIDMAMGQYRRQPSGPRLTRPTGQ